MNGNTPYAGPNTPDVALSSAQHRALRESLSRIASRTREFLPDEYTVGSEVNQGSNGPQATVAVRPPVGNPVSAGFTPDFDEGDADLIPPAERDEVARGLAASAALQVKVALANADIDPPAR
ncbi:DUF5811 family protein [Salarchaeum sp. JOR-1]|uniref:DUF5811 family protein n=1 Tax=Salarchaeum sp. JOR-1 TaxID=2599399 RepID=UPI00119873BD|nr:DUF5811 family protein [Salarchaeum sp. JOR-1]QDX40498.1 hypothetical protein FQU85_06135 [Salarchaeum sp. JOR-1]